jgi:glutamate/tyrosine decarboxylase-like PLP-dependent enzyme
MTDRSTLLARTLDHARTYFDTLPTRPVHATMPDTEIRSILGGAWPQTGRSATTVIDDLARVGGGTIATQGPRFFGFVVGGSLPVATAADWLVSTWDQNSAIHALSPVGALIEDIAAGWLRTIGGVPDTWSVGFVTGCQMANFTALAAARHHVLAAAGWNVDKDGLAGAPLIDIITSDESHYTIFNALRFLGFGDAQIRRVPADDQGRMRADALKTMLAGRSGPCIVCSQAGNVNTGAFDPVEAIADVTQTRGAWLHVDGAFGFWARVHPELSALTRGWERADSIATDGHKWLNAPYDSGLILCARPDAHRRAMTLPAAYIVETPTERDSHEFVPEESRRLRGLPVYAALATLGRDGLVDLIGRGHRLARRMADRLRPHPGLTILNDVVLNQVLVRVSHSDARADARTRDTIARIQADGTCWLSGTTWHGMAAIRISIANWSTTDADIDLSADAIIRSAEQAIAASA